MSIDSHLLSQLNNSVGQLLYLGFDPEHYLSSRRELSVLSAHWSPADFKVGSLEQGEYGIKALTITLGDADLAWSRLFKAAAKTQLPAGIACRWYLIYESAQGWQADLKFNGELEFPRITASHTIEVTAAVDSRSTAETPRVPFESPYSLAPGEERVFNNTTYRVE